MSLVDNGNGLSAADIAAVTGANNGGLGSFGGDGAWLILILLLFAAFSGNGWGGNNGNGAGYGGGFAPGMMPLYMNNQTNDVQRGFDQQAVMGGIGQIQGTLADAAVGQCNQTTTLLGTLATMQNQNSSDKFDTISTLNNGHNAILNQMAAYEMARQQCCCDNKAAIADLKYTVATEACADRNAVSNGVRDIIQNQNSNTQAILDKLCQQEIDALKTQNANLQTQINMANLAASQAGQTAQILADNAAQTAALRQALNPAPIPAYTVPNPYNSCGCNQACGC